MAVALVGCASSSGGSREPQPDSAPVAVTDGPAPTADRPEADRRSSDPADGRVPDGATTSSDGRADVARPATDAGSGKLTWLLDGETGRVQVPSIAHDGSEPRLCGRAPNEVAVVAAPAPVYPGRFALRSHMDQATSVAANCTYMWAKIRNLDLVRFEADRVYWQGWAVLVPADARTPAGQWEVGAWHPVPGHANPVSLELLSDLTWRLEWRPEVGLPARNFGVASTARGAWHEFVARFAFSRSAPGGSFKLWYKTRDAATWQVVAEHTGKNAPDAAQFPFHPQLGLSAPGARWPAAALPDMTLFFDEIRVGEESRLGAAAAFAAVAPGSGESP